MRRIMLAAASALALTVGAAQAQQTQGTADQATPPPPAIETAPGQPVANLPPAPNPLDS